MPDWLGPFGYDAAIYVGLATLSLLGLLLYSPRMMVQDYPPAIRAVVPAKTSAELRQSLILGLPFVMVLFVYPIYATFGFHTRSHDAGFLALWAYAFGIAFAFNLWDWLIIDWLLFCAVTPKWLVISGSEGHPAYKDYFFHFRGFLIGTVFTAGLGLLVATTVTLADRL
jgi:hypothetical protein